MLDTSKIYTANNFGDFKVVEYINATNIVVEFTNTGYKTKTTAGNIKSGKVKDKLCPSVFGVGFVGDGEHAPYIKSKVTKQYNTWVSMLERCYSSKLHERHPTYTGCTACEEWHNFQNFAEWFDANYIDSFELDKDIKVKGNKIYSPDTCVFVSAAENSIEAHAKRYKFIDPNGKKVDIYNLARFCRENNLTQPTMSSVNKGKIKNHKGWIKANKKGEYR